MGIINYISDLYEEADYAHGLGHILTVHNNAIHIATYHLNITDKDLLRNISLAAVFHDIGRIYGTPEDHHITGAKYVEDHADEILNRFPGIDIDKIRLAVLEHRASYRGEYSSIISEVVSAADRGSFNTDHMDLYNRSYLTATEVYGHEPYDAANHAYHHVREKYGRDGYAYGNKLYVQIYQEQINDRWDAIDKTTKEQVIAHLYRTFNIRK